MSDFDRAMASLEARNEAIRRKRVNAWERIQDADPILARLLVDLNKHFGKPKSILVEIDGERIL